LGLKFIASLLNPIAEYLLGGMAYIVELGLALPFSHLSIEWPLPGLGPMLVISFLVYFIYGPIASPTNPKPLYIPLFILLLSLLSA
jgi:hypothetical protein